MSLIFQIEMFVKDVQLLQLKLINTTKILLYNLELALA